MAAVNIDELNEIMGNDLELIQECFADFLIDYPQIIADLKTAADKLDFPNLKDTAHKLKGILKYLAAETAAETAMAVEAAGRKEDPENLDDKIGDLETECQNVILFIDEFS